MNIFEKLSEARIRLQNTQLKKSGQNKFAGYQYFELGDFLPTIQTIFHELGLIGIVSYTAELATLRIVDATVATVDAHLGNKFFIDINSPMGSAALKGCHEVQNIGAVETYQRRYLWMTAMEIVEHDALDATVGKAASGSAKEVIQDEWNNLDADTQIWLGDIATDVKRLFAKGDAEGAYLHLEEMKLTEDNKLAIWSQFDSKLRSAIKKIGAEKKVQNG